MLSNLVNSFRRTAGVAQFKSLEAVITPPKFNRYSKYLFSTNASGSSSSGDSNQLLLTLSTPSESPFKDVSVGSVTLPGVEGEFTVTPQHSPMVTFLRNGVLTVRPSNTTQESQYFMSDGICLIQGPTEDNASSRIEVLGVELVPVEFLDKEKTAQVMQELLQNSAGSTDEWDKTKSILGQELCSAIMRAAP